jgi:hypothetical protein
MWTVVFHPEAEHELTTLDTAARAAVMHSVDKLAALGPALPFPHQSNVQRAEGLRELRPRAGRSRWRALYGRVADVFVIAAIGPEASVDPRRFRRAVAVATRRLTEVEA